MMDALSPSCTQCDTPGSLLGLPPQPTSPVSRAAHQAHRVQQRENTQANCSTIHVLYSIINLATNASRWKMGFWPSCSRCS